jgi:hypothetical protein
LTKGDYHGAMRRYGPFQFVMKMRPRQVGFSVGIGLPGLACLLTLAIATSAFAQIDVITDAASFGQVNQGDTVETKFQIRNSGTEPVAILGLEFSMPGMNARVKQVVAGESVAEILISWDTTRLRGEVEGQAVLTLDSPQIQQVALTLRGTVVPAVEILPRPAVYISQFSGEGKSANLRIRNNRPKQLNLLRLENLGQHFQAEYKVLEDGKLFEISISIPAETAIGRYQESLLVHTDDPELARIHLEVNVLVKADVFTSPGVVDFGRVSRARIESNPEGLDLLTQTLVINRRDGEMAIESIDLDIPFIWVKQEPEGRSAAFRLDVGLDVKKWLNGPFAGYITLSTNDPAFSEIKIPVTGEIAN